MRFPVISSNFFQSPQFLINSRVIMEEVSASCFFFIIFTFSWPSSLLTFVSQVYSPFESTSQVCEPTVTKISHPRNPHDRRNGISDEPILADWETLDRGVWNVVRALKLLPPDVIEASVSTPFSQQRPVLRSHAISCSELCDPHLNNLQHMADVPISPVVGNVPALGLSLDGGNTSLRDSTQSNSSNQNLSA
jgi:hypothetical protein